MLLEKKKIIQYLVYQHPTDRAFPNESLKLWLQVSYDSGWYLTCTQVTCRTSCSSVEKHICTESVFLLQKKNKGHPGHTNHPGKACYVLECVFQTNNSEIWFSVYDLKKKKNSPPPSYNNTNAWSTKESWVLLTTNFTPLPALTPIYFQKHYLFF